jgi:4-amino-4-deoxy-L-arabinose transferase-like glycosyltransferase
MQTASLKKLFLIILIALILRVIGIPWGLVHGDYYLEPDEQQHVGIAKNLINKFDSHYVRNTEVIREYNSPGFGSQLAIIGYPILKISGSSEKNLFLIGRLLTLVYSLLLIILVYFIALNIFSDEKTALLAALLLSVFDLGVTYSHYGVPEIPHAFWSFFSLFLISLIYQELNTKNRKDIFSKKIKWMMAVLPFTIAITFSLKYDMLPAIIFGIALIFLIFKKKITVKEFLIIVILCTASAVFYFYLSTCFSFTTEYFEHSRKFQYEENYNAVIRDSHLLLNPILYFFAVLCGTNVIVMIFFLYAVMTFIARKDNQNRKVYILFLSGYVVLFFLFLWGSDAPFVRRAVIFLPYVALMAAYGIMDIFRKYQARSLVIKVTVVTFIVYSLALTIVSQSNFLFDTRYKAAEYLNAGFYDKSIAYSRYAPVNPMPKGRLPGDNKSGNFDILVLHEAQYGRYWKSFTTPFKTPECCDEVYHCNKNECVFTQNLLSGNTSYLLKKSFTVTEVFPERIVFRKLFGTYESFLGDTLIFMKSDVISERALSY